MFKSIMLMIICSFVSTSVMANEKRIIDKIDYPFVDDSRISNSEWCAVDLVKNINAFKVGAKKFKAPFLITNMIFLQNGDACWDTEDNKCKPGVGLGYIKWTKTDYKQNGITFDGVLTHEGDKTASGYLLKTINEKQVLFLQHKSGDYSLRGMKPGYHVFEKCNVKN